MFDGGVVVVFDEYGVKVVVQIFKVGGNVVDVVVVIVFILVVIYFEVGNIGGGGFMILYMDGKLYFFDYCEVVLKVVSKIMYLDDKGEVIENFSLVGVKVVGVLGIVMGFWEVYKCFGKLFWSELLILVIGYV